MGTNEFNSESAPQQNDGDYRAFDQGIEEPGSLFQRVRAEQRELEVRINSLHGEVLEYSALIASIRQSRTQRVEERSRWIEEHAQSNMAGVKGVEDDINRSATQKRQLENDENLRPNNGNPRRGRSR